MDQKNQTYNVGDIVGHKEIGKSHRGKYIYVLCPVCEENPHWIRLYDFKILGASLCHKCHYVDVSEKNTGSKRSDETKKILGDQKRGKNNPNYKLGYFKANRGYLATRIPKDHPFYCMTQNSGKILLHRLVMANHLKRPLLKDEIVHHKNHNVEDNDIENLELMRHNGLHTTLHNRLRYSKGGERVEMS